MKKLISALLLVIGIAVIFFSVYTYLSFDKAIPEQPITFLVFVNSYPYLFVSACIGLILLITGIFLLFNYSKRKSAGLK